MAERTKTLFSPVVDEAKLNRAFQRIRSSPASLPARWMLDQVYQDFDDPDGNFLEQFQTTGFDARFFELYLHAYFSRSGFLIDRTHENPDFIVRRDNLTVAMEATTVNPATSGVLANLGKKINELSSAEFRNYQQNELAIRFGSPLLSKLSKKYWELPHCKDLPFVIAIQAFHDEESLTLTDYSLARYLFGVEQTGRWLESGKLALDVGRVYEHQVGEKTVPSNFFVQPDAGHLSAVMFTNSGTHAKFARMGYQHGIGCDQIEMSRIGYSFNPDPDAKDPTFFSYNMDEPPLVEPWGQGIVVLHNPNSLHPIPHDYFIDAVSAYVEDGLFKIDYRGEWHPFSSKTAIIHMGEAKKKLAEALPPKTGRHAVAGIPRREFEAIRGERIADGHPIIDEQGWFTDESNAFLGVVTRDKIDNDWGYVVLARDEHHVFRAIEVETSLPTRDRARMDMQVKIDELLSRPQRIFPQGR